MQDQNTTSKNTTSTPPNLPGMKSVVARQEAERVAREQIAPSANEGSATSRLSMMPSNNLLKKIADKVKASENILVALSRDPSVDELAAAIGLTMFLDGLQKHTTAIYSGQTPDALQFLQPEGTFESNTDSLQDFIISLNKEKADHLRYKLDGDFVRVYITPYKTLITEEDLEFSRGDFNVDLVLAIGVPSVADLDAALSEHGRIMHDAMTVDITCDVPGNFGEIEWSDPGASSVSEMVTKLIFELEGKEVKLDKDVATALLTGIVAATGRFSNDRTNSDTLQLASNLMGMGADQQLISAHVMDNDPGGASVESVAVPEVKTDLAVDHSAPQIVHNNNDSVVVTPEVPTAPQRPVVAPVANKTMNNVTTPQVDMNVPVQPEVNAEPQVNASSEANVPPADVATQIAQRPDYAQMMTEVLSDHQVQKPTQISSAHVVAAQPATGQNVVQPVQQDVQASAEGQSANVVDQAQKVVEAAQPVEKPSVVLPPPPPPATGDEKMMPPVLPPVQASGEVGVQEPTAKEAGQAGAFQIPGA